MTRSRLFPRVRCLAVTAGLLLPGAAMAQRVVVVTEQTQAAIQAALDALGGPGTVILPRGRYQVEGTLRIRDDGVTLQGSGMNHTVLFRVIDGTSSALVRVAKDDPNVPITGVRITGIRFKGATNRDPSLGELSNGHEVGVLLENAADFRVDHSFFTHTGFAGVRTNGSSTGVVDHCIFDDIYKPRAPTEGYGVVVYGIDLLEGEPFGSGRATFIEDSSFGLCRHAVAANKGARYVFRYNYVAQNEIAHAVDAHGTESGSTVGTEWVDVNNNFIEDPIYRGYAVRIRGGMGVVWSNTFIGYDLGIRLTQDTPEPTGPVYIWDNYLSPEGNPMVRGEGAVLSPPIDYMPYPYPHPLAEGEPRCDG